MERNKCVSAGGNHNVGKDACRVCVWVSWCWEHYSLLTAGKDKCSPSPTPHTMLTVRERACFKPGLKCFAVLWHLFFTIALFFTTCKWLNRSSSLLSPHCALWGPSFHVTSSFVLWLLPLKWSHLASTCTFLTLKTHLVYSFGPAVHGIFQVTTIFWVLRHVEGAPDEVWRSVKVFICSGGSGIHPALQQDLWATAHCPEQFLEMFFLVGFQFLMTPVSHLLWWCPWL